VVETASTSDAWPKLADLHPGDTLVIYKRTSAAGRWKPW
jgi:hypothetical protein